MKFTLIVFFILTFTFLVLYFPFKTRIMGHFDFVELIGFYSLKIMKLRLVNGKVYTYDGKIKSDSSVSALGRNMCKEKKSILVKKILSEIDIKKLEIYFSSGVAENAFASAMICGLFNLIIKSSYGYLSNSYIDIKLYEDVDAKFGSDNFKITFDIVISISFIKLILALIYANKKFKEELSER